MYFFGSLWRLKPTISPNACFYTFWSQFKNHQFSLLNKIQYIGLKKYLLTESNKGNQKVIRQQIWPIEQSLFCFKKVANVFEYVGAIFSPETKYAVGKVDIPKRRKKVVHVRNILWHLLVPLHNGVNAFID